MNKDGLLGALLLVIIITSAGFSYVFLNSTKSLVKGVSTSAIPSPTVIPIPESTPKPTSTLSPTPTNPPIPTRSPSKVTQSKQYGGWYWQPDLGRAQRWLGTDTGGKDIWSDTGDPTPTPTPSPVPSYPNSQNGHNMTQTKVVLERSAAGSGDFNKQINSIIKIQKRNN